MMAVTRSSWKHCVAGLGQSGLPLRMLMYPVGPIATIPSILVRILLSTLSGAAVALHNLSRWALR